MFIPYGIFKEKDMREYGYDPHDTRSHFDVQDVI